jgi:hypothetical protein
MKKLLLLACALLIFPFITHAGPSIIGVLEQPQCAKEKKLSVRVLFVKDSTVWKALDDAAVANKLNLVSLKWTVAFDGRNLGSLKITDASPSAPPINAWYYKRDKLFEVPTGQKIPTVKNDSESFMGWCNVPEYRPLVLVSEPNFVDPEKWKSFMPAPYYKQKLYVPLKLVIGRFKAFRCVNVPEYHMVPFDFQPDDLVLYKSFRSAAGRELVSIGLDPKKINCDGPPEPEWSGNWFIVDGDKLEFLGNQMEMVDAGDYDKDGCSELLFWHSGYNRDGYILIYNGLKQKTEYLWGYH